MEARAVDLKQFCVDHFSLLIKHVCVAPISHKFVNDVNEWYLLGWLVFQKSPAICVFHEKNMALSMMFEIEN